MTEQLFHRVLRAQYTHLEEETASYCIQREGDQLFLLFEWSNGRTDWRNNLDFPAKPYRDMADKWYAHRGFLRVWKAIEPHLEEVVADPTVREIYVAGYSHGAAIALLCFEYCRFHRPDIPASGIGYGCPRVVWGFTPKRVRDRFQGFVVVRKGCDLVTHVPPALFGFRHVGDVLKIGETKGPIKDHYPDEYSAALQTIEREE